MDRKSWIPLMRFSKAFKGKDQKEIDFLQRNLVSSNDNKMIEFIFNIVTTEVCYIVL